MKVKTAVSLFLFTELINQKVMTLTKRKRKLIVVHGLYMNSSTMIPLCSMMRFYGYKSYSANYATLQMSLHDNAQSLLHGLKKFKQDDEVDFIGHSLGGLLIRHLYQIWPEGFQGSRVITMGTPHQGSSLARNVQVFFPIFLLGGSWNVGLDGLLPQWNENIPLLSIAGTQSMGLGSMCGLLDYTQKNDGVVLVRETVLEGMREHILMNKTHLELILSPAVAKICHGWLQKSL